MMLSIPNAIFIDDNIVITNENGDLSIFWEMGILFLKLPHLVYYCVSSMLALSFFAIIVIPIFYITTCNFLLILDVIMQRSSIFFINREVWMKY